MAPLVLYFAMGAKKLNLSQKLKLDGIRRFAALRGWEVATISRDDLRETGVGAVLARHRPVGCVVDGVENNVNLPPRLGRTSATAPTPTSIGTA